MKIEELKEFVEDNNCRIKALYDFGARREWLTEGFLKAARDLKIKVDINNLRVELTKEVA